MEEKEFDYINIIPFVDIMLVLLAIVLATATFIATGEIPVNLPSAKNIDERPQNPVVITIASDGRIFVNNTEIKGEVADYLKDYNRDNPIVIRADREVFVEKLVDIVDAIKEQSFRSVSMEVVRR